MDLRITLDLSERFYDAVRSLADSIRAASPVKCDTVSHALSTANPSASNAECQPEVEPPAVPSEPEVAAVEPEPEKKSKKKAATKKPVVTSEPPLEASNETVASESAVEASNETVPPTQEAAPPAPPAAANDNTDPYNGTTLLGAVKQIMDELAQRGIELADANARIRKETEARGLQYPSAACLMKAVGYAETRRIALGE